MRGIERNGKNVIVSFLSLGTTGRGEAVATVRHHFCSVGKNLTCLYANKDIVEREKLNIFLKGIKNLKDF